MPKRQPKVIFAPGALSTTTNNPSELDDLVDKILTSLDKSKEQEYTVAYDIEELAKSDPEWAAEILEAVARSNKRTLQ